MIDILLITVPRRAPNIQYATVLPEALGLLQACVIDAGFTAKSIDFNIKYFRKAFLQQSLFGEIEEYFVDTEERDFYQQMYQLSNPTRAFWNTMLNEWVETIKEINPKVLGISIFSDQSLRAAFDFCEKVRVSCPNIKILIGGLTISMSYSPGRNVGDFFRDTGMCDDFIAGEGDVSIVEYLKGNAYGGVNNYDVIQVEDLNSIPFPIYNDLNFGEYVYPNPMDLRGRLEPMISITGSRGCIKACMFCDVGYFWPKFRWIEPNRIADLIIYNYENYGATNFHFSDSIVNASPPMAKTLFKRLIEYQEKNNVKFFLTGQMIVREINQYGEEMFELMSQAGFKLIMYGIESGSPYVRETMKKPYSQEALYYTLDNCLKHGITAQAMIIVGYPTETEEDFGLTCDLIEKYRPERPQDAKITFSISTFTMDNDAKESRLYRDHKNHNIVFDDTVGWTSPILDRYSALKRSVVAYDLLDKYGFPIFKEWLKEIEDDIERIDRIKNSGEWEKISQGE